MVGRIANNCTKVNGKGEVTCSEHDKKKFQSPHLKGKYEFTLC